MQVVAAWVSRRELLTQSLCALMHNSFSSAVWNPLCGPPLCNTDFFMSVILSLEDYNRVKEKSVFMNFLANKQRPPNMVYQVIWHRMMMKGSPAGVDSSHRLSFISFTNEKPAFECYCQSIEVLLLVRFIYCILPKKQCLSIFCFFFYFVSLIIFKSMCMWTTVVFYITDFLLGKQLTVGQRQPQPSGGLHQKCCTNWP